MMPSKQELDIKLSIACVNLARVLANEVVVNRYLQKDSHIKAKWRDLAKKHN